jgi:hypothetical protein
MNLRFSPSVLIALFCTPFWAYAASSKVKVGTFLPNQVSVLLTTTSGSDLASVKLDLPDGEFEEPPMALAKAKARAKLLDETVKACQRKKHQIDFFEIENQWADLEDSGKPLP